MINNIISYNNKIIYKHNNHINIYDTEYDTNISLHILNYINLINSNIIINNDIFVYYDNMLIYIINNKYVILYDTVNEAYYNIKKNMSCKDIIYTEYTKDIIDISVSDNKVYMLQEDNIIIYDIINNTDNINSNILFNKQYINTNGLYNSINIHNNNIILTDDNKQILVYNIIYNKNICNIKDSYIYNIVDGHIYTNIYNINNNSNNMNNTNYNVTTLVSENKLIYLFNHNGLHLVYKHTEYISNISISNKGGIILVNNSKVVDINSGKVVQDISSITSAIGNSIIHNDKIYYIVNNTNSNTNNVLSYILLNNKDRYILNTKLNNNIINKKEILQKGKVEKYYNKNRAITNKDNVTNKYDSDDSIYINRNINDKYNSDSDSFIEGNNKVIKRNIKECDMFGKKKNKINNINTNNTNLINNNNIYNTNVKINKYNYTICINNTGTMYVYNHIYGNTIRIVYHDKEIDTVEYNIGNNKIIAGDINNNTNNKNVYDNNILYAYVIYDNDTNTYVLYTNNTHINIPYKCISISITYNIILYYTIDTLYIYTTNTNIILVNKIYINGYVLHSNIYSINSNVHLFSILYNNGILHNIMLNCDGTSFNLISYGHLYGNVSLLCINNNYLYISILDSNTNSYKLLIYNNSMFNILYETTNRIVSINDDYMVLVSTNILDNDNDTIKELEYEFININNSKKYNTLHGSNSNLHNDINNENISNKYITDKNENITVIKENITNKEESDDLIDPDLL